MAELTAKNLEILCEDGPVIAVNKPPGVITQGAPQGVDSLVSIVKAYLKEKYHKPGDVYLGVPHRLDRPVSGVVVFSRNSKCAARLAEQFAKREVTKTYVALLERIPKERSGTLRDWIYRIPDQPQVKIVDEGHPDAREAHLNYTVLDTFGGKALVEVDLGTGRMHQIRIQFASRGCAIVGDGQYGSKTPFPGSTSGEWRDVPIALHARRLTLKHPVRYDDLTIAAPVPKSWEKLGVRES